MSIKILDEKRIDAFGRHLRLNEKSPHTIKKYLRDTEAFRRFAAGRPLSKELTVAYKEYLLRSGKYTDRSINSMYASLRALFRFLKRSDCNVTGIRMQEPPYCPENKNLTMEEYRRLLDAAKSDRRLQLVLKVLGGTGIRISELECLTVETIREKRKHATVRVFCKKKSREILIPDELRRELFSYIEREEIREGPIFRTSGGKPLDRSNIWKQMKRLCKKADVDETKVFPHNIRKLFARTFYEKTHDIAQLACLLGHSSVNTTMLYIKRTEREVREKIDQIVRTILQETANSGCAMPVQRVRLQM